MRGRLFLEPKRMCSTYWTGLMSPQLKVSPPTTRFFRFALLSAPYAASRMRAYVRGPLACFFVNRFPRFALESDWRVSGWKFAARDGSPQTIHRCTPGYFLLAAYAKSAKSFECV